MSIGATFTQTTRFGIDSGPTYQGAQEVAPGVDGNVAPLIDVEIVHHATPSSNQVEVLAGPIDDAKLVAYGFKCTLVSGSAALTSGLTVVFEHALGVDTDFEIVMIPGMAVSSVLPGFTNPIASIKVTPDLTADLQLQGIVQIDL